MLKTAKLADFTLGIDQLSGETSLPPGTARDALNVDFDVYGNFRSRAGFTKLASFTGAHSLWASRDRSYALYAQDDQLKRMVLGDDGTPLSATVLTGLTRSKRMSFFEHADEVFFTNGAQLGMMTRSGCRLLGVTDPTGLTAAAITTGTMPAGKYSTAYSFIMPSGEESGLSPLVNLVLAVDGGIAISVPPISSGAQTVRLYCTPVNGDVLYQVAEFPFGLTSYSLTDPRPTKASDNIHLSRMPAGIIVRVFNGRVLVALGKTVVFSEPFRYGLTSQRHNYVNFNSAVVMIEPVDGGVYVGTQEAVYFLAGDGPATFKQSLACTNAPTPFAGALVHGAVLPPDIAKTVDGLVAVWVGHLGYSIGLPSGLVHDVQAARISLPIYESAHSVVCVRDGIKQVITLMDAVHSTGQGSAVDSPI